MNPSLDKQILGLKFRIIVLSLLKTIVSELAGNKDHVKDKLGAASRVSRELVNELNRLEKVKQGQE